MDKIAVFKISDISEEKKLDESQVENIKKIFRELLAEKKNKHLEVECKIADEKESILYEFANDRYNYTLNRIADKLVEAEKKNNGDRNKNIAEGHLFIKYNDEEIIFLKMEKTEVIDENTYEILSSLGLDKSYYKLCIYRGDVNSIKIIDKNKTVAKYWYDKFLNLQLVKNSTENTKKLLELIKENKIFIEDIENKKELENKFEEYILNNSEFDKCNIKNYLINEFKDENLLNLAKTREIYSEDLEEIDSDFIISKSEIKKVYKKSIKTGKNSVFSSDNFDREIKCTSIQLDGNRLIIRVEDEYLDEWNKAFNGVS